MNRETLTNGYHEDDQPLVRGEIPSEEVLQLLAKALNPSLDTPPVLIEQILETTSRWNSKEIPKELGSVLNRLDFHPRGTALIPQFDTIPFFKRVGEKIEVYKDKHARNREENGKSEAAEFGVGKVGDQDVVVYAMNYDFMGGSLSSVAGEKLLQAIELAEATNRPLLTVYSSGGARQDENGRALYQMERGVVGLEVLKEKAPNVPNIAILLGEVWGGVTASSMPRADLRVAYTGTRMGFAGGRVIAAHEGSEVSESAQRVEVHALQRNVDVLVRNTDELMNHLTAFFANYSQPSTRFEPSLIPPTHVVGPDGDQRHFRLSDHVVAPALYKDDLKGAPVIASMRLRTERAIMTLFNSELAAGKTEAEARKAAEGQMLTDRYRNLLFDVARPDTEMILQQAFQDVVPLYNHFYDKERGEYVYPPIIAGIGRIGLQAFMVAGNQPSYRVVDSEVSKILSTPKPADLKYLLRTLNLGDRLQLPLVLLTDTPGAEPSLDSELQGQFEDIANVLARYHKYGKPIMSIVTGLQGSGGGLVTSPRGDSLAVLSKGLMTVAEPGAASVIVYGANATHQNRTDTILALSPSSEMQRKIGLVDAVIPEADNPYETIAAIREHIIKTYGRLALIKSSKLLADRWNVRLRDAKPFKVSESGF